MRTKAINKDQRDFKKCLIEISNYLYVNEGLMKDRIFSDLIILLSIKLNSESKKSGSLAKLLSTKELKTTKSVHWKNEILSVARTINNNDKFNLSLKDESIKWILNKLEDFNLSGLPVDVKGEAFQVLVMKNLRGDRGEYFTPEPLVKSLSKLIAIKKPKTIIDPACGTGGFLYGAFLANAAPNSLYGIEQNNDVASAAKLRIEILGGNPKQIQHGDAFRIGLDLNNAFDAVLMNPPFGSRAKITDVEILEHFELSSRFSKNGKMKKVPVSPEVLFLELALKMLDYGGELGTVIPDGILQNRSNLELRNWLLSRSEIKAIVSCPTTTFIPYGTGVKTSILFLEKKKPRNSFITYMGISSKIGYDSRGNIKYNQLLEPSDTNPSELFNRQVDEDLSSIISDIELKLTNQSFISNLYFFKER
jgi:type I restriction enzyme M protein